MVKYIITLILWFCVCSSGLLLASILNKKDTATGRILLILCCSLLGCFGYMMELSASTLEEALAGLKIGYLGKVFIPPLCISFLNSYFNLNISKFSRYCLFWIPVPILACVVTCEYNSFYYTNIQFENNLLILEKAPLYLIYMMYNLSVIFCFLGLGLSQLEKTNAVSKRIVRYIITAGFMPIIATVLYLMNVFGPYDPVPVSMAIAAILLFFALKQYDVLDNSSIMNDLDMALIITDQSNMITFYNSAAVSLFPQIANLNYDDIEPFVKKISSEELEHFELDNKSYKRNISELLKGSKSIGNIIYFNDVTDMNNLLQRDSMTGLYNHVAFYEFLEQKMHAFQKDHTPLSIAVVDIDNFKKINDNYGHANGDLVLISLAHLLQNYFKDIGLVCRYGGEEFTIIATGEEATKLPQHMKAVLRSFSHTKYEFTAERITFSCGVCDYEENYTSPQFFDHADQALYQVKKNGKNNVRKYISQEKG